MEYRTVYQGGKGEIVEKKSRFIADIRPVSTEEEALAFIEEILLDRSREESRRERSLRRLEQRKN